ncbi:hypothetical protein PN498_27035 [Oscillatoria sp. CS-180]|uniref:hypothetical protein n=1 Tax=Oscillatoria sp. CS-180 TaxID=3021720 RepID=UPI00232C8110|nr:hypothetical protein [Oscillatoria sp. CS-180]MDB9529672.1 hypothetical protein [Oscillatoria sp. CS-180]
MFTTLSKPYEIAGQIVSEFAIATYKTLTSQQAQRVYRDAWTITRVIVQVTALALYAAGLYTIIAGRKFRAYYEAEWAADVERFLSYPDRCLTKEAASEPVAATTEPVTELIATDAEAAQAAIPDAVQAILNSNVKTTQKLRAIATHFDIRWRNAHGEGRHLLNAEIRDALSDRPEILAAL